jgi:8-oxo-dGTP pyrophosphatase MutT (NUDIX family)
MAEAAIERWCAAALLVTPDGRYLMQLRDATPTIFLPDHWALFGGGVDLGESAEAAMRRELMEELEFAAAVVAPFTKFVLTMPFARPRHDRLSFFTVPVTEGDIAGMVLQEGAAMHLFAPADLAAEPRVAPWDLAAVLMHARRGTLFGR